jgi:drug/metabolite transporter (DMT)-like permease
MPVTSPLHDVSRTGAFVALVAVMAMWGSNAAVAKLIMPTFGAIPMTWARWFLVMLLAAPFAWRDRGALRAAWRDRRRFLVTMTLVGGIPQTIIVFVGLDQSTAVHLGLLNSAIPVLILLLGAATFGHRIHGREGVGVLISAAGVLVIVFEGSLAALFDLSINRGDAIMMIGMVMWALYTLKLNQRPEGLSLATFMFAMAAIGLPLTAPLAAWEIWKTGLPQPVARDWLLLLYMSAIPTLLSTQLYGYAIERVGPAQAGVFVHAVPLFSCLFAALIAVESLYPYHAAGLLLVAGGAFLSTRSRTG